MRDDTPTELFLLHESGAKAETVIPLALHLNVERHPSCPFVKETRSFDPAVLKDRDRICFEERVKT